MYPVGNTGGTRLLVYTSFKAAHALPSKASKKISNGHEIISINHTQYHKHQPKLGGSWNPMKNLPWTPPTPIPWLSRKLRVTEYTCPLPSSPGIAGKHTRRVIDTEGDHRVQTAPIWAQPGYCYKVSYSSHVSPPNWPEHVPDFLGRVKPIHSKDSVPPTLNAPYSNPLTE